VQAGVDQWQNGAQQTQAKTWTTCVAGEKRIQIITKKKTEHGGGNQSPRGLVQLFAKHAAKQMRAKRSYLLITITLQAPFVGGCA
jgi:hypothetical protein